LALLHEVALALSGEFDRRRLYEGIVHGARRLLDVALAAVVIWDPGRESLCAEAATDQALMPLQAAPAELPVCVGKAFLERMSVTVDDYAQHPRAPAFARSLKLTSILCTPLLRDGAPSGVLFVAHRDAQRRFDAEDLRTIEILAGHVSLSLGNAETLAAATRRLARVEELGNALRSMIESRDHDTVLERALDCATTVLGADRAAVYLADAQKAIQVWARRLSRSYLETGAKQYRRSMAGILEFTRSPIFIADVTTDPRTRSLHESGRREGIRSVLLIPLIHRDEVMGALGLYHDLVWTYEAEDLVPLRALADQVALALANASLHEKTGRQLAQLRVLQSLVRAVSDPVSADIRCQRGAHAIVTGGGAASAWVFTREASELRLVAQAGGSAAAEQDAEAAARAALQAQGPVTHSLPGADSLVAAPFVLGNDCAGALVLAPPRPMSHAPRPVTTIVYFQQEIDPGDAQHEFVATAAGQLGTAIVNARLFEEATTMGVRLTAIIEGMPNGILVFDRNDRLVFYNKLIQEFYGLTNVDLSGWTPADFVREVSHCFADPSVPQKISRRVSEHKDKVYRMEFELTTPRAYYLSRVSAPVTTPDGAWYGQVVLYHDLTEKRTADRLTQGFLSAASSELSSPLRAAKGFAEESRRAVATGRSEEAAGAIHKLGGQLDRLSSLVADLLDVTLIEAGRLVLSPSRFDFAALAREIADKARKAQQGRHPIQVTLPDDPVRVLGDRDRLGRVLAHLVSNALQSSPAGSGVAISVLPTGSTLDVSVTDQGIGIPHHEREAVFERYAHASNVPAGETQGLGLGLYLSREIVRRHGGQIALCDAPGGGTAVCVRLPTTPAVLCTDRTAEP
jgi:PAS domain S-box-containing protein